MLVLAMISCGDVVWFRPEEDIEAEVLLQKAERACRRDARVTKLLGDGMCVLDVS